jgi:hypothetical protein
LARNDQVAGVSPCPFIVRPWGAETKSASDLRKRATRVKYLAKIASLQVFFAGPFIPAEGAVGG